MDDKLHSQEDAFGPPPEVAAKRRFYFDVREGVRFVQDHDGLLLPDLDTAEREAAKAAAAIGRDLLPAGTARSVTVEVRNEHGQRVVTATVTLAVDRVHPEPTPPLRLPHSN
jgi:hypothetical protein